MSQLTVIPQTASTAAPDARLTNRDKGRSGSDGPRFADVLSRQTQPAAASSEGRATGPVTGAVAGQQPEQKPAVTAPVDPTPPTVPMVAADGVPGAIAAATSATPSVDTAAAVQPPSSGAAGNPVQPGDAVAPVPTGTPTSAAMPAATEAAAPAPASTSQQAPTDPAPGSGVEGQQVAGGPAVADGDPALLVALAAVPGPPPIVDATTVVPSTGMPVGAVSPTDGTPSAAPETAPAASGPASSAPAAPVPAAAAPTTPVMAPPVVPAAAIAQPALAPSAVAAQAAATPPSLPEQVVPRIASVRALGDGVHRLTLRVEPEAIGAVRVVAEVRGDAVRLELFGGTEAAREALRAALPELRRDLASTGLQAQLDLGTSGDRQPGDRTSRSQPGERPGDTRHDLPAEPDPDGSPRQPGRGAGRLDVLA